MDALLNVGCGARFHPDWVNLDLVACAPAVVQCDVKNGLPYPANEFDAVYHSHVLEHIERDRAPQFLCECWRVLKIGGVMRVAVPDLEAITKAYLKWLELTERGDSTAEANYDWSMLELYDQFVRRKPGGSMLDYLRRGTVVNIDYVRERCGDDVADLCSPPPAVERVAANALRAKYPDFRAAFGRSRRAFARFVLGKDYVRLQAAQFLEGGELHRWMYDKVSLSRLLRECGFTDPRPVAANESLIPRWTEFGLDADPANGRPRKPDSLYVEAVKR